jgi:hypothetical protein
VLFVVLDAYAYDKEGALIREHVALILGDGYVLSFVEGTGARFDAVKNPGGRHWSVAQTRSRLFIQPAHQFGGRRLF